MTSQLPLERLHWLAEPDSFTLRTEGPRLILRCGPFASMESVFPCGFEDQDPSERRLARLLRSLDELLENGDDGDDGDD